MLIPLLAFALIQPAELKPYEKGSWLYHACKGAVRWIDAPDEHKPEDENENFANCTSYLFGFSDGLHLRAICLGDASMGTSIRVYIAYMDKNPKLMDRSRSTGLELALLDAYPCPVRK